MKLYEMPRQYEEVWRKMSSDEDVSDEEMLLALSGIDDAFNEKVENCAKVLAQLAADAESCAGEIARLTKRKRAAEKRAEWLKGYVKENMVDMGMNHVDSGVFRVAIQKNPPSVLVEDETKVPEEYYVTPEPRLSKSSIKDAIDAGVEVPGCRIHRTESLRIR